MRTILTLDDDVAAALERFVLTLAEGDAFISAPSFQHEPARKWLDAQLNSAAPVGLPWHSLLAFLRIDQPSGV